MVDGEMLDLYERLGQVGLSKSYVVQKILPDWWSDEIAGSPAGYLETISYLSKHLGVALSDLRDPDVSLAPQDVASARFKLRDGLEPNEVTWAKTIAVRAAEIATHAVDQPFDLGDERNAQSVRQKILSEGKPWVSLENLVAFCWQAGIPVLHIPDVPGKKMDGMVVESNGRPAVVLSVNKKHDAWLLFILAHELGHIYCGHLNETETLVDEEYNLNATEEHEQEANSFAVELITGDPEAEATADFYPKAHRLARNVLHIGKENRVDPGALILNFAYHDPDDPWALASAALNELDPEADAPSLIRKQAYSNIDWESLPTESAEFLRRIMSTTGSESEAVVARR